MNAPAPAKALRRLLTAVSAGLLIGDVSRRVADAVIARIEVEIQMKGGRATVITQSNSPQGFDVCFFGHEPMVEIDGLKLSRVRFSQEKVSENRDTI